MKKIVKWLGWGVLSIVVILAIGGFCVTKFFGNEVVELIVGELNKNLNVEIRVGKIDFTVFRRFPDASIEFSDVIAFSSKNINKSDFTHNADTLLVAKRLFLQFNVWDIVEKRYKIKAIHLEDAFVQVLMDKQGQNNFQIMKEAKNAVNNSDTASLSLNLKKVSIKNTVFIFDDRGGEVFSKNTVKSIYFSGNFTDESFSMSSKSSLVANNLTISGKRFLTNNALEYDVTLDIFKKHFAVKSADVSLKKIQIAVSGEMDFTRKPTFDLQFDISKFHIQEVLPYLPEDIQRQTQPYQIQGILKANGAFKGVVSENSLPSLQVQFVATKSQIHYNKELVDIEASGIFKTKNLAKPQSFHLTLDTLSATHGQCSYFGKADLTNFDKLDLQTSGQAIVELAQLNRLLQIDKTIKLSGFVESPIEFSGRMSEFDTITPSRLLHIIFKNHFLVRNVSVQLSDGFALNDLNGACSIRDNCDLLIDSMSLRYKHIVAQTSGTVTNLLPYILFANENLRADLLVHTSCIDFDELIAKEKTQSAASDSIPAANQATPSTGLGIPSGVVAAIDLSSDCFVSNKLSVKDVKTKLTLTSSKIIIEGCSFSTMGGKMACDLLLEQLPFGGYTLKTTANLTKIQADKLFYSFNNFDQDFLTEKNIQGAITAKITMFADLTSNFDVNMKTLNAECSATITNGRLINFAPMRKLSQFVSLTELEDVNFKTLKNDFVIKNEVLYIPKMDIVSNAFDMSLFGEHAFSNAFDYHLKVLLNDMLSKKRKNQNTQSEFGEIEDDGLVRIRLPLRIKGTTDDFSVNPDYKLVKEEIKESLIKEKNEIGRIFKEEFNLGKKDTVLVKKKSDPEESTKLQFQWDD